MRAYIYLVLVGVLGGSLWLSPAMGASFTFTTIDVPFQGAFETNPSGINDRGQIAGFYFGPPGLTTHGFVLSDGNFATFDALLGTCCTDFHAINDQEQIVGSSTGSGVSGGFLFAGGKFSIISVPGSMSTGANGINNAGQIVGATIIANEVRGFLLDAGIVSFIQVPGAQSTEAVGINDAGQIVGIAGPHGFLLSNGVFSTIDFPGALATGPQDVNSKGTIVGSYQLSNVFHGFIFDDQGFATIDFPGSTFTHVVGINNAGQIVGSYGDSEGFSHAFLGTPVPEPSSWLLLATGCVGLLIYRWRLRQPRLGG